MKRTNKVIIGIVLIFGTTISYGQNIKNPYPDTLKITTDSQIEVSFSFYRMSDKEGYITNDLWRSILGVMESAIESSPNQEGIKVTYQKVKKGEEEIAKVEVNQLEKKADIFIIDNKGMKEIHSYRIDFIIYQPKMSITFSLEDLSDLDDVRELNVESVWGQIAQKFENEGTRNLYFGEGAFKYGKANLSSITGAPAGTDNIEFSAGIGIGFYRDRFVPDLNFKLAVNFPDRLGNPDLQFGLLYTQQYFFEENEQQEFDLNINGFLTGFFSKEFSNEYKIGIGVGMLVQQNGNFYKGDTHKISLYTQRRESKINFTPELIFTDNFKQVIPALKFGLSF